jgi:hypothetical protein
MLQEVLPLWPANLMNLGAGGSNRGDRDLDAWPTGRPRHGTLDVVSRVAESKAQERRDASNVNFFSAVDLV